MDLSIVIPAYNEERRIASTLRAVESYFSDRKHEIIVVNDGSTDSTGRVLAEMSAEISSVRVIGYETNKGKGYAVRQGMLAATGRQVLMMDADLATPIEEFPKLGSAVTGGYDVAIGSREGQGAVREVHQSFAREMGGRGLNLFIQALAVPGIRDTQCGFKLFTRECIQAVFPQCFLKGWGFDVEVLYLTRRMGFSVAEIPIRWSHKEGSKVNPLLDGLRIVFDLLKIRSHRYDFKRAPDAC